MAGALRAARGKPEFFRVFKFSTLHWKNKIFDSTTKKQYTFKPDCMRPFFAHPDFIEYTKTAYPGTGIVRAHLIFVAVISLVWEIDPKNTCIFTAVIYSIIHHVEWLFVFNNCIPCILLHTYLVNNTVTKLISAQ